MKKDKLKRPFKEPDHEEIPIYTDPENKEGRIPTDILGSYSGNPLDGGEPIQDADDL